MPLKRLVTFCLILSVTLSTFYLPVFTPRAKAFLGFGDIVADIKAMVERMADGIAMQLAQRMIDDTVRSTVNWAQSGFNGNPAYVTDPEQYFTDIADGVVGQYIAGSKLNFLCSPFQAQVKLALRNQYLSEPSFQCAVSEVVENLDNFYNDFNEGGWDAWFAMTQNPGSNPYGAFYQAQLDINSQIADAVGLKDQELNWNRGFLSFSDCIETNPPRWIEINPTDGTLPVRRLNPRHVASKPEGACIKNGPTKTPGSVIQEQLNEVLPSGLKKLQVAQHIDQLISSFATGLLNRYVFGNKGLFARGGNSSNPSDTVNSRTGKIDLDGDNVPDGQDADQDGLLASRVDVCYHGGIAPACARSGSTQNSPYFGPVCQATVEALISLNDFSTFISTHADQLEGVTISGGVIRISGSGENFRNKADSDIWGNRASEVSSSVDDVLSAIQSYRAPYFDNMEVGTNRFANYIGKVMHSLVGDGHDLDLAKRGNGGGGLARLQSYTQDNLNYFRQIKEGFGECSSPNIASVANVRTPVAPTLTSTELALNNICATPMEVADYLSDNPNGNLESAFPCSANFQSQTPTITEIQIPIPLSLESLIGPAQPSNPQLVTSYDAGPSGYDGSGYDGSGYDGSGYDGSGYDGSGYDGSGYDGSGYDGSGYDGSGYDASDQGGFANTLATSAGTQNQGVLSNNYYASSEGNTGNNDTGVISSSTSDDQYQFSNSSQYNASDNEGLRDPGVAKPDPKAKGKSSFVELLLIGIMILCIILIIIWLVRRHRNNSRQNQYQ